MRLVFGHELFHRLLMQPFVNSWVLCVNENFSVSEDNTFWRLLIKDDIELNFILLPVLLHLEHRVGPHFRPGWSQHRVVLHGIVQKVKCVQRNLDVCGPTPSALLNFFEEGRQCVIALCCLFHREHEHASEHLVKNYSNRPYVDFVAVARSTAPVSTKLLRSHHQGRPFESFSSFSRVCN